MTASRTTSKTKSAGAQTTTKTTLRTAPRTYAEAQTIIETSKAFSVLAQNNLENPKAVLLDSYPVDVYIDPAPHLQGLRPFELYRLDASVPENRPSIEDARVGVALSKSQEQGKEQGKDQTQYKTAGYIYESTPGGLRLTTLPTVDSVVRVNETRTVVIKTPEHSYLVVPSPSGACCGSALRSFTPWATVPLAPIESVDTYALATDSAKP